MSYWIESHQTLRSHPKLIRLAGALGITSAQAAGHLHFLWWWCMDYAQDGDLGRFGDSEVAYAAGWTGDAAMLRQALKDCGWIDADESVHGWHEYAGKLIERRAREAGRKAEFRKAAQARPQDVRGTSAGHTADVQGMSWEPNLTQPNLTQPNQECVSPVVAPARGFPTSESEAEQGAHAVGCPAEFAKTEWNKAEGRGGCDSKGVPIRSWVHYLRTAWTYHQAREVERGNGAGRPGVSDSVTVIRNQAELERVEEAIKKLRDSQSHGAMGPIWDPEDAKRMKELKARRKELLAALGMTA